MADARHATLWREMAGIGLRQGWYQIGEDQARSWSAIGKSMDFGSMPIAMASNN